MSFSHPGAHDCGGSILIPERNTAARMFDKHEKLKRGLIAARDRAPCHVMFVDADDCVHRGAGRVVRDDPDASRVVS